MPNSASWPKPSSLRRSRLAVACNSCREAKVRCDVSNDACRRCQDRGYDCVASDPKTGKVIPRRLAKTSLTKRITARTIDYSGLPLQNDEISVDTDEAPRPNCGSGNTPSISLENHQPFFNTFSPYASGANEGPRTTSTHPEESWPTNSFSTEELAPILSEDQALEVGAVQNNDGGSRRAVLGSTNMQVLAAGWIDRYFAHLRQSFRVSSFFKYGMQHAVEGGKPRSIVPLATPSEHMHNAYLNAYQRHIYPLFPALDISSPSLAPRPLNSDDDEPCSRAALLAVYSLGADSIANEVTSEGTAFLHDAYAMVVDLMNSPYLMSIQALILISLAFRTRSKDGQAGIATSLAIKMALSLGLHRHIRILNSEAEHEEQDPSPPFPIHSRVWWSLYCLDIMSTLSSGNPRSIHDGDSDRPLPIIMNNPEEPHDSMFYFKSFISLCRVMSRIGTSPSRASYTSETDSRTQILHETVKADHALHSWYNDLPINMRSGTYHPSATEASFCAFLNLYYYQCLILVHRTALTTREESYRDEVTQRYALGSRECQQLLGSQSSCYDSTLEIIKIFHSLEEHGISIRLIPISHISYAAVVLSIWILKHPFSGFQPVNMANLEVACNYAHSLYQRIGQDPLFSKGWLDWFETIQSHLNYQKSQKGRETALSTPLDSTLGAIPSGHAAGPPQVQSMSGFEAFGDALINSAGDATNLDIWDWSSFLEVPMESNLDISYAL